MKVFAVILFSISFSLSAAQTITLAVGHDHYKMVKYYPFYAASWDLLNLEFNLLGYKVIATPYPWARAKEKVSKGLADGLFLAANFKGRESWAILSDPIGQDQFGLFTNKLGNLDAPIGTVRTTSNYGQLTFLNPNEQIQVATAQQGLNLLSNKKLSAFVMSRSYGDYLLSQELKALKNKIVFDSQYTEVYTAHLAIGKQHPEKQKILNIVNQAIKNSLESGRYLKIMQEYQVATYQLLEH